LADEDLHLVEGGHRLFLSDHVKGWIATLKSYPGMSFERAHISTVCVLNSGTPVTYLKSQSRRI